MAERFIKHEPMAVHQQHVQHAQHVQHNRKSKQNTIQFYSGTSPIVLVSSGAGIGIHARQAARLDTPARVRNPVTKLQKQLSHNANSNDSGLAVKSVPTQPLVEQHSSTQPTVEQNGAPVVEQQLPSAEKAGAVGGAVVAAEAAPTSRAELDMATGVRLMKLRNKSEDAITDLLTRIPDVGHLFDVQSRIGNGTFSTVLLATLKREANLPESMRRKFAIKHHIPTSHPDRIMKELQCMTKMGGMDNVVGIHCCMRCDASAAFVMPYMPHDRFHDFYTKMDVAEIRLYMRNLLVALRHVHKFNVIHRDVKPSNFLYNRRRREFLLVDFGLAQHVNPAVSATGTAAGQLEQRNRHPGGAGGPNSKRFRDRETEALQTTAAAAAGAAAVAAVDAGLGGAVKRMRLNEEGGWGKMPLKPVNEIAHAQNESKEVVSQAPEAQLSTQHTNQQQQHMQPEQTPSSATGTGTGTVAGTGSKYNTNRSATGSTNSAKCFCFANPSVCLNCLMKKEVHASRAGTPGYRPPEVLLKYADQTTAVDVWSVGVIFLSLMSSVYPFFKAPNDYIALAEIVTIFGDQEIRKTALALERMVTLSQRCRPLNLRKLCLRFRNRAIFSDAKMLKKYEAPDGQCEVCKNCDQYFFNCLCEESDYLTEPLEPYEVFPASAYDLLERLLEVNPHKRITASEALQHSFFSCQGQGQNFQSGGDQQVASTPRKARTASARQMTRRRFTNRAVSMGIQPLQQLEIEQQLLYPAKLEELQTVLNKL
ncbi:cell division cycle 7-related protein kinase [Drosophila obscura]|uniref:cell division cycle 7-related protein kinase n=1 Tax=Drosophila obscura TaxID=7282 RepID=UPI001BB13B98|nr:cell division cycle 7-related protein kinase [Drosophila obscura]XP_022219111.2 cell division cycle 7-related protein kinase [Drosophila obscura]